MLRSEFGLDLHHSATHSTGLEQNVADFCFLCASCSRIVNRLYTAVDDEMKTYTTTEPSNSEIDVGTVAPSATTTTATTWKTMEDFHKTCNSAAFPEFRDPLLPLKQLLRFDDSINGVVSLQLFDSAVQRINSYNNRKDQKSVTEAAELCRKLRRDIRHQLLQGNAVVFQSAEMDSFADVVVVGPNKLNSKVMIMLGLKDLPFDDDVSSCHQKNLTPIIPPHNFFRL